jgi:hypothetical protein
MCSNVVLVDWRWQQLSIARVEDLPWGHHPFRCALLDASAQWPIELDEGQAKFEALVSGRSDAEVNQCPYHQADWRQAADLAVYAWRHQVWPDSTTFDELVDDHHLEEGTIAAAHSLFVEPIAYTATELMNGQHRVCALKLASVEEVIAVNLVD